MSVTLIEKVQLMDSTLAEQLADLLRYHGYKVEKVAREPDPAETPWQDYGSPDNNRPDPYAAYEPKTNAELAELWKSPPKK